MFQNCVFANRQIIVEVPIHTGKERTDPPPDPMVPQPVTQESVPLKKVLPEAARQTGWM